MQKAEIRLVIKSMDKQSKTFDSLFDRLDSIASQLERLTLSADRGPFATVPSQAILLTTSKAAEFLGIFPKTIYNNPERFKAVKLRGGGLRFRKEDLEELIMTTSAQS